MKTKIDIIVETALHFNTGNRGFNNAKQSCSYLDPDGNSCAVGRCMNEDWLAVIADEEADAVDGIPVDELHTKHDIDTLLKPEYRGQGIRFWINLQTIHDNARLWTSNGINGAGIVSIETVFGKEARHAVEKALMDAKEL